MEFIEYLEYFCHFPMLPIFYEAGLTTKSVVKGEVGKIPIPHQLFGWCPSRSLNKSFEYLLRQQTATGPYSQKSGSC